MTHIARQCTRFTAFLSEVEVDVDITTDLVGVEVRDRVVGLTSHLFGNESGWCGTLKVVAGWFGRP
jgi:hypothetical protein